MAFEARGLVRRVVEVDLERAIELGDPATPPAVARELVDLNLRAYGEELDTAAGHVDLRGAARRQRADRLP